MKYVLDATAAIAALNDAGSALEQGAVLVTSDGGLLDDSIPGLRAENWLE